jgi:hypothetical protein
MKPLRARIANLWCEVMHSAPMWPSHGQYECRTCGRRRRVCWEVPLHAAPRAVVLCRETQARSALIAAAESSIR